MSRTLFWYIFKDLLRIFLLTSGALAGIMSFGGLLRPLTQHGLDATQVGWILTYFIPAMTTYSLPVAALFATTMVYGRLSNDNELTAMRASGISYLKITYPAMILGLSVSLISLLFLCFIVPVFTLKVEKVVYSNLARIVASEIERTHEVRFDSDSVHALEAHVLPPDPNKPRQQCVVLIGPTIVTYDRNDGGDRRFRIPADFYTCRKATVYITQVDETSEPTVVAIPENGAKFPRKFLGATRGGVEFTEYGPVVLAPPIKENSKFMVLPKLHELYLNPGKSRAVQDTVADLITRQEQRDILRQYADDLNNNGSVVLPAEAGETYTVTKGDSDLDLDLDGRLGHLILTAKHGSGKLPRLVETRGDVTDLSADAGQIRLSLQPDPQTATMSVLAELESAIIGTAGDTTARSNFRRPFNAPLPERSMQLQNKSAMALMEDKSLPQSERFRLMREWIKVRNQILGEMNSRTSFALACFILVMVGCCLGIMFRSGNFLSAFGVSVVPALMSILLIVTGQHTCENVPAVITTAFKNPLPIGLALIWLGNIVVAVIATTLLTKLQRQ